MNNKVVYALYHAFVRRGAPCPIIAAGTLREPFFQADVAKLVDAADLKSAFRKEVWVRVPPSAPQEVTNCSK